MSARRFGSVVLARFLLSVALVAPLAEREIDPIGLGAYAVGRSNLEIVEHPAASLIDYLKGKADGAASLSLAEILARLINLPARQ